MVHDYDFVDMRLLLNVIETKSMSKGAAKSFLSPPAATHRIKLLEEKLAMDLLVRTRNGISTTPAGSAFAAHARQVLAEVDEFRTRLKSQAFGVEGSVRLWASANATSEFIPPVLQAFSMQYPGVRVCVQEKLAHDVVKAVGDGAADIGIVWGDMIAEQLEFFAYRTDRLVAVGKSGVHGASGVGSRFVDLLDHDFVSLSWRAAHTRFLSRKANECGRRLRVTTEVGSFDAVCRLVEAGAGVAVLPASVVERYSRSMRLSSFPIDEPWAMLRLSLCTHRGTALSDASRALLALLVADGQSAPAGTTH